MELVNRDEQEFHDVDLANRMTTHSKRFYRQANRQYQRQLFLQTLATNQICESIGWKHVVDALIADSISQMQIESLPPMDCLFAEIINRVDSHSRMIKHWFSILTPLNGKLDPAFECSPERFNDDDINLIS